MACKSTSVHIIPLEIYSGKDGTTDAVPCAADVARQYIRLKQAANLLATPGQNITNVMYACGFSNLASFSTMFKKFYGMSPRDYIKEKNSGSSV